MLSIEEISDRFEIQQLLIDYSTAIDQRRFDDLDVVFTSDAYIDYRVSGGIDGHFPQVKAWLKEVLPNFPAYFHLLGNIDIRITGDSATSRAVCFNPIVMGGDSGQNDSGQSSAQIYFVGIWYVDEFIRTAQGWRMSRRVEEKCFDKLV
ncbi:MAG: nuclear transport factor 2 family protein [Actinomycetia bacterium]|nr:nuclear transport factor 2 family protein [Actinomycetes bacterium]